MASFAVSTLFQIDVTTSVGSFKNARFIAHFGDITFDYVTVLGTLSNWTSHQATP